MKSSASKNLLKWCVEAETLPSVKFWSASLLCFVSSVRFKVHRLFFNRVGLCLCCVLLLLAFSVSFLWSSMSLSTIGLVQKSYDLPHSLFELSLAATGQVSSLLLARDQHFTQAFSWALMVSPLQCLQSDSNLFAHTSTHGFQLCAFAVGPPWTFWFL